MKTHLSREALAAVAAALFLFAGVQAQQTKAKPAATPQPVIFAVLMDGRSIEPVAFIGPDGLSGLEEQPLGSYYGAKSTYTIIFGGKEDGSLSVSKSNIGAECGRNSADVVSKPAKAQLKGLVMALATNAKSAKSGSGVRRRPTAAERTEIESLVRAEFTNQKTPAAALKSLRYHNLTALDVDNDGSIELVGSYWVAPSDNERRTLFFIAEQDGTGKYRFTHQDYARAGAEDVMSGDVKDMDSGVGHELLLDVFDYDNDGTSEIFTIGKAFEGNNYYAYRRQDGKWVKVLDTYVYSCAY